MDEDPPRLQLVELCRSFWILYRFQNADASEAPGNFSIHAEQYTGSLDPLASSLHCNNITGQCIPCTPEQQVIMRSAPADETLLRRCLVLVLLSRFTSCLLHSATGLRLMAGFSLRLGRRNPVSVMISPACFRRTSRHAERRGTIKRSLASRASARTRSRAAQGLPTGRGEVPRKTSALTIS